LLTWQLLKFPSTEENVDDDMSSHQETDSEAEYSESDEDLEEVAAIPRPKRSMPVILPDDHPSNDYYVDGIEGLAGIVSFRKRKSYPELSENGPLSPLPLFLEPYSKLGRAVPSRIFMHQCLLMDSQFIAIHGDSISQDFDITAKFMDLVKHIDLAVEVQKLFGMLRLRIRIRCINQIKNKNKDQVLKVNQTASKDKNTRVYKVNQYYLR
jgi:hypothetical protein